MSTVRFGPAILPSRESPDSAIEALSGNGYSACEIDFEGGFWMSWDFARRLGRLARDAQIALSVHAPIPAFLGHLERGGKKQRMAMGMLDHSAGLAKACGAELVVFHPGFLLGRQRSDAVSAVIDQFHELEDRLQGKGRMVAFGLEVMGRVRELGTLEDVVGICQRTSCRPVLDFAHLHAVSDGGFTDSLAFSKALEAADGVLGAQAPFHIHFSDVTYANRNERAHVPYGQGTLRAEPLARALAGFERPATVIGESPDEVSNQAICEALGLRKHRSA